MPVHELCQREIMKNILVIGGSYFAGRVLLELLVRVPGYQVYVFNRGKIPLGWQGIHEIKGDRNIPADLLTIPCQKWDAVVDFCGYTPQHIVDCIKYIPGTINHYIFISTTSVYAENSTIPLVEEAQKVEASNPELGDYADYGLDKWNAECALKDECHKKSIDHTILRPAIIFGRYNYAPREFFLFEQIIKGYPLVIPETISPARFSFAWVVDLARIIYYCLQNESVRGKSFNIAGPEMVSYSDLIAVLEKISGRTLKTIQMSVAQIIRQKVQLPFPPDIDLLYDGSAINQTIGNVYTPFAKAMEATWRYYTNLLNR